MPMEHDRARQSQVIRDNDGNIIAVYDPTNDEWDWQSKGWTNLGSNPFISDGENFDGQGTSDFTNLNSLGTDAATINSQDGIGVPASATSVSPTFGSWRQVSADRPGWVEMECRAETDGSSNGRISVDVDESGGTNPDKNFIIVSVHQNAGSGSNQWASQTLLLTAGAQYRIVNDSDPNNDNSIGEVREAEL